MKSIIISYVALYSTSFIILINLSYVMTLHGKNVRDAKVNEFPFVVSIEVRGKIGTNFCVGTLISPKSVLTAAHCLIGLQPHQISIMVGSNDLRQGTRYQPESWIAYDQWMNIDEDLRPSRNDIAVITLLFSWLKKVKICKLASLLTFAREDLYGSKVRIAGWGFPQNERRTYVLKTAILRVMSNQDCEDRIESVLHEPLNIRIDFFCSFADSWIHGDCGDSGAPIMNKRKQVVGIHRGICPESIKHFNYSEEFINQNLINIDLHLYQYRHFINAIKV